MANGMEFMLRSFGLDPEVIKKNVAEFGQIIVQIRDTLARIEQRQIALESRFEKLEAYCYPPQPEHLNGTPKPEGN